ncbi:Protein IMPACT-B [Halotydeus destructor]|nr:Protein IMPACT-B [Halotydeus destructor]
MDNIHLQEDEVEALSAIYGEDWIAEDVDNKVFSIILKSADNSNNSIMFQITMPLDYPLAAPPLYTFSAPWMTRESKRNLMDSLEEVYCQNTGESIVYMWIEKVREFLNPNETLDAIKDKPEDVTTPEVELINYDFSKHHTDLNEASVAFYHGEPIIDRRSAFQAHLVQIDCPEQAKQAIEILKNNKKISSATHNITAYRISGGAHKTCLQDCDDDGETHAGARLLHLLQILDVKDVMVMVSRWYGGIQLGPDRFKHINNAARTLLDKSGFLDNSDSKADKKSKKSKP